MAREGRNPTCDRSHQESNRRTCTEDEGRVTGSATLFGRATTTDRGRRCERRIWQIGWRQRWFVWKGWACSKWKAKSSKVNEDNRGGELPERGWDRSGNRRF